MHIRRLSTGVGVVLVLAGAAAIAVVPGLRWRAQVVGMKAGGEIHDLSWGELLRMLRPAGPFYLKPILRNGNPFETIRNPYRSPADVAAGEAMFLRTCAPCHGGDGRGKHGPDLRAPVLPRGGSDWALYRTVTRGIPGTEMRAPGLTEHEAWQVIGYLQSLRVGVELAGGAGPSRNLPAIRHQDLAGADSSATAGWLSYSGSYSGRRFSWLSAIDTATVRNLDLAWIHQIAGRDNSSLETSPLVVGSVMFATGPWNKVVALDAATGRRLWEYQPELPAALSLCCGPVNRGLAVEGQTLFLGTLDARLIALDAATGALKWEAIVADYRQGYSITAAPLVAKGKVLIGVAGGEYGIRGFIDAYDAGTGDRAWRFYTIPAPGEPGSGSWSGDSWRTGGGPAWLTGSYDPGLDLVYFGVGNPAPNYNSETRRGDNLYSNSVVALELASGRLRWHFQFTPRDDHDWDAVQIPVLADVDSAGQTLALMLWANRNAFYYVLDRSTGRFRQAREFARQTWAKGIDPSGRPIRGPGASPSVAGTLTYPSASGATNWWSPSFSPRTGLFYVPVREEAELFFSAPPQRHVPGRFFSGGGILPVGGDVVTAVRALDGLTGKLRWEFTFPDSIGPGSTHAISGLMSTAGDVVFAGAGSHFLALNARTGGLLWQANLGGPIRAAPITFMSNGRQMVTIAAGNALITFALEAGIH